MSTDLKPPFGLVHVIPDNATAAWGARLIVTQDGHVDVPHDRMGGDGPDEARHLLYDTLIASFPQDVLRETVSDLLRYGLMNTRNAEDFILYMDAVVTVHANTNRSAGYCYVTAWIIPETTAPNG